MLQWVTHMARCHFGFTFKLWSTLAKNFPQDFHSKNYHIPFGPEEEKKKQKQTTSSFIIGYSIEQSKLEPQVCLRAWVKSKLCNLHCIILHIKTTTANLCDATKFCHEVWKCLWAAAPFSCHTESVLQLDVVANFNRSNSIVSNIFRVFQPRLNFFF